mmetsp:Transcript_29007/g.46577  ORF Transcript_29007/g.46577 Transcript_29007/m.46577 type:complete len:587 (+) Transcript_29007:286-2046(+)
MEMKTKKPKKEEGISSTHAQKPCSSLQQRHSQDYHCHGMKRGCQQQHIERGGIQGRCGTHCGFPKCSWEGCDSKQSCETGGKRGFCGKHGGIPPCKVEGCNSIQHYRTGGIKGFCGKHGGVPQRSKSSSSFERSKRKRQDKEREDSGDETECEASKPNSSSPLEKENDDKLLEMNTKKLPMIDGSMTVKGEDLPTIVRKKTRYNRPTSCVRCHKMKIRCDARRPCGPCQLKGEILSCKNYVPKQPKNPKLHKKRLADHLNPNFGKVPCSRTPGCLRPKRHAGHCRLKNSSKAKQPDTDNLGHTLEHGAREEIGQRAYNKKMEIKPSAPSTSHQGPIHMALVTPVQGCKNQEMGAAGYMRKSEVDSPDVKSNLASAFSTGETTQIVTDRRKLSGLKPSRSANPQLQSMHANKAGLVKVNKSLGSNSRADKVARNRFARSVNQNHLGSRAGTRTNNPESNGNTETLRKVRWPPQKMLKTEAVPVPIAHVTTPPRTSVVTASPLASPVIPSLENIQTWQQSIHSLQTLRNMQQGVQNTQGFQNLQNLQNLASLYQQQYAIPQNTFSFPVGAFSANVARYPLGKPPNYTE